MIGSGVKRGAGQSRTREVLAKAPSQGYAGCTRGPAGGTADHSVREKDGSLWVGAGAGGSEGARDGGGRGERGLPVVRWGQSPRRDTQAHLCVCTVCVNFVVSDRKVSLSRCSGKAGREERIQALVHGVEFQGKPGFR